MRGVADDRNRAAQALRALAEFESDVAAADHDEPLGQRFLFEEIEIREIRRAGEPRDRRHEWRSARVNHHVRRADLASSARDRAFA